MSTLAFPYTLVVLAPFRPVEGLWTEAPVEVSRTDDLDQALDRLGGVFRLPVDKSICPALWLEVSVHRFADFKPRNVCENCGYLKRLAAADAFVAQAVAANTSPADVAARLSQEFGDLPLELNLPTAAAPPAAAAASSVDSLLSMVAMPEAAPSVQPGLTRWRSQIAGLMSASLRAIFSDPGFRAAEAAWRGVDLLLRCGKDAEEGVRIELVPTSLALLPQTLELLTVQLAAHPPNALLVDFALDTMPARMELWGALANIGATLLAPVAAAASPEFFHVENLNALSRIGYISHYLEGAAYAKWRTLQHLEDAGWLAATLNGFLLRAPYGQDNPARPVAFDEAAPLWLNPVWAFGATLLASVAATGWPHLLTGARALLQDLAVTQRADGRSAAVEADIDTARARELAEAGFSPLVGVVGNDKALLPARVAVDGSSLSWRLFFNRILSLVFTCHTQLDLAPGEDPALALQKAFADFFARSGHAVPSDLEIRSAPAENGLSLSFAFTPPGSVLQGGTPVTFSLDW